MGRTVTFKNEAKNLVGAEIKVGDKAPDFSCLIGLDVNTLAHTGTKPRLFSVVPSLDTGVCSMQTKKFESELADVNDKVSTYTVSLDLPFARSVFVVQKVSAICKLFRIAIIILLARIMVFCWKGCLCHC